MKPSQKFNQAIALSKFKTYCAEIEHIDKHLDIETVKLLDIEQLTNLLNLIYDLHYRQNGNGYLHLYPSVGQHQDAFIAGTVDALKDLSYSIETAIRHGYGTLQNSYTNDGEGYTIYLYRLTEKELKTLPLPDKEANESLLDTVSNKLK